MVYAPPHFIAEYRAARKHSIFSSDGWWINRWPFLGWLETFLKVIAWFYASRISAPNFASPDTRSAEIFRTSALTNSAEIWIFLLATALITAAVFDRLFYREIISMVFVLPNNWAHWTVFRALVNGAASKGHGAVSHTDLRIFCWLMFAGDIVKLVFFAVHDFNIANVAKYVCVAASVFDNGRRH